VAEVLACWRFPVTHYVLLLEIWLATKRITHCPRRGGTSTSTLVFHLLTSNSKSTAVKISAAAVMLSRYVKPRNLTQTISIRLDLQLESSLPSARVICLQLESSAFSLSHLPSARVICLPALVVSGQSSFCVKMNALNHSLALLS